MKRVIGMHFVCKNDLNVFENGDGTTGGEVQGPLPDLLVSYAT